MEFHTRKDKKKSYSPFLSGSFRDRCIQSNEGHCSEDRLKFVLNSLTLKESERLLGEYDCFHVEGDTLECVKDKNHERQKVLCIKYAQKLSLPSPTSVLTILAGLGSELKKLLVHADSLTEVLYGFSLLSHALAPLPVLSELYLEFSEKHVAQENPEWLVPLFLFNKTLSDISVHTSYNNYAYKFFQYRAGEYLRINGPHFYQEIAFKKMNILARYDPVKEINFTDVNFIHDEDILVFFQRSSDTLKKLTFLQYDDILCVFSLPFSFQNLTFLEIGNFYHMTEMKLLKNIKQLVNLKELIMMGLEEYNDMDLISIFANVGENWNNLVSLSFHSCDAVTDDTLFAIAVGCQSLRELHIVHNETITDFGLSKIISLSSSLKLMEVCGLPEVNGYFLINLASYMSSTDLKISLESCDTMRSPFFNYLAKITCDLIE